MSERAPGTAPDPPLPVTVIGGYLGVGKTTLVNHLLRTANGVRLAVLVNDFGTLAIDADLVESRDGNVLSISGGCICCSYGSALMEALEDLDQRTPRPDHVLLETSGVALPGPVAASLTLLPQYVLDAILVLADAETIAERASDRYLADTIARQLADADLVVLNKTDMVSTAEQAKATRLIAGLAPKATIIPARHATIPPELATGGHRKSAECRPAHAHGDIAHRTLAFELDRLCDADTLLQGLTNPALGIIRAKGIVADLRGAARIVQVVGRRGTIEPVPPGVAGKRGLVVIGLTELLDAEAVARAVRNSLPP